MATRIIMPKLGMAMKEGVIAKWLKQDGDPVTKDEPVAVVMSKKITYNLTAPASGLLRIVTRIKETRPVGTTLAFVAEAGEELPSDDEAAPTAPEAAQPVAAAPAAAPTTAAAPSGFVLASPAARRIAREKGIDLAKLKGSGADGLVTESDVLSFAEKPAAVEETVELLATSAARHLARELGIDLAGVSGSGPGGRITEQDVEASHRQATPPAPTVPPAPAGVRSIPFAGMRQAIAEHMVDSLRTMAQITMQLEVDATELVRLRGQLKGEFELTYTDLLVKAVARALKRHPLLNSALMGDEIQLLDQIHIGVAVALEEGLIVPVIRDADRLNVREIAQEARRLATGAREGSLSVDEVAGSTFTITNLGSYGIDGFTPIINAPEAAILGVGRIVEKPAIHDGEIAKRSMMVLSLTVDHRIVDGAPAAEFLRTLKELVESPYRLLV